MKSTEVDIGQDQTLKAEYLRVYNVGNQPPRYAVGCIDLLKRGLRLLIFISELPFHFRPKICFHIRLMLKILIDLTPGPCKYY
jgi:hypothetical protein